MKQQIDSHVLSRALLDALWNTGIQCNCVNTTSIAEEKKVNSKTGQMTPIPHLELLILPEE